MNSKQKKEPPHAAHALTREVPLIGAVRIVERGGSIVRLDLGPTAPFEALKNTTEQETPLLREAFKQLDEYLTGKRRDFDLPLAPEGTDFQRGVWRTLQTIPYGQTRSYRQVAEAANCHIHSLPPRYRRGRQYGWLRRRIADQGSPVASGGLHVAAGFFRRHVYLFLSRPSGRLFCAHSPFCPNGTPTPGAASSHLRFSAYDRVSCVARCAFCSGDNVRKLRNILKIHF